MSILKIDERLAISLDELRWEFARSGGPGGQNVNKVNSKVVLRWSPGTSPSLPEPVRARLRTQLANKLTNEGELRITSQATRDQGRNLADCLAKLRAIVLTAAHSPKARRPTRPTLGSRLRRSEDKVRRSETKQGRRKPSVD